MRNGVCYQRPTLVPLTVDKEFGSWGTPVARDDQKSPEAYRVMRQKLAGKETDTVTSLTVQIKMWPDTWPTPQAHDAKGTGPHDLTRNTMPLPMAAKMWPTPRASMNENRTTQHAPSHGVTHGRTLAGSANAHMSKMWPTPTTKDTNLITSELNPDGKHGMELRRAAGHFHLDQTTQPDGKPGPPRADLNPQFVAALMGVPPDWLTHSTSEATDSSHKQQPKHSNSFSNGQENQ